MVFILRSTKHNRVLVLIHRSTRLWILQSTDYQIQDGIFILYNVSFLRLLGNKHPCIVFSDFGQIGVQFYRFLKLYKVGFRRFSTDPHIKEICYTRLLVCYKDFRLVSSPFIRHLLKNLGTSFFFDLFVVRYYNRC